MFTAKKQSDVSFGFLRSTHISDEISSSRPLAVECQVVWSWLCPFAFVSDSNSLNCPHLPSERLDASFSAWGKIDQ